MKKLICSICGLSIEEGAEHNSCKINCVCGKQIPSLDFYYLDEHDFSDFHRFCSEECLKIFTAKVANNG